MKVIVFKEDSTVKFICNQADIAGNQIDLGGLSVAPLSDYEIFDTDNIPEDFVMDKYCYDTTNQFYKNPSYVIPVVPTPPLTQEERMVQLESNQLTLMQALADMYEAMLTKGTV
ncbi:MAG: hypothetical protein Q8910_00945 [Bacteroidota bacterium]|nr:hypothetical protein [Bacteroidota bacterium]